MYVKKITDFMGEKVIQMKERFHFTSIHDYM